MFQCHVCKKQPTTSSYGGSTEALQELVSEVFEIEGNHVLVENIPASVCVRCREATFSRHTTERIRRIIHGEIKPVRTMVMNVFAYA